MLKYIGRVSTRIQSYRIGLGSLDIGTTNVKFFIYSSNGEQIFSKSTKLEILEPEVGAFEIDPDKLWNIIINLVSIGTQWAED